jgi:hypothetical protein
VRCERDVEGLVAAGTLEKKQPVAFATGCASPSERTSLGSVPAERLRKEFCAPGLPGGPG